MRRRSLVLRARAVLPIHQAAIANGAVVIQGGQIHSVCRWKNVAGELRGGAIDLGETIIMPGLVNSHCHLDYTDMAGEFPPPRIFTDWLKLITTAKGSWRNSDYAKPWSHGAEMLLRTGTTTVGDIEAVPELLPEIWDTTPLTGVFRIWR